MTRSLLVLFGTLGIGCAGSAPKALGPPPSADGATVVRLTRHLSGPSHLADLEVTIDGQKVFGTKDAASIPSEVFHQTLAAGPHVLAIRAHAAAKCGMFSDAKQIVLAKASQPFVVGSMPSSVVVDVAAPDPWGAPEDRLKLSFTVYEGGFAGASREVTIERDDCGPEVDDVGPWRNDPMTPVIIVPPVPAGGPFK